MQRQDRQVMVMDTAAAIGGVFSKGGVKKYLESLDGEPDG